MPCAPECKKTAQLDITRCDLPGRIDIDLLEELRRANDPKLPNLKLDTVARTYLGWTKIDLPAKEIFAKFRSGRPEDIAVIAEYCARDCVLVTDLTARLKTIESVMQMAFICGVTPSKVLWGGQTVKVKWQLFRRHLLQMLH